MGGTAGVDMCGLAGGVVGRLAKLRREAQAADLSADAIQGCRMAKGECKT